MGKGSHSEIAQKHSSPVEMERATQVRNFEV
jgi:hypothetical protein